MLPKSAQRFWENDMHQNKDLKARRPDPLQRDALQVFERCRESVNSLWPRDARNPDRKAPKPPAPSRGPSP
ncbi:MAG: hypothetical protein EOQ30_22050 [Mesorhizobium sp.]|nr:MAG: hypothetical protein EOQ30_22050 [Mesorhizobium sp.]